MAKSGRQDKEKNAQEKARASYAKSSTPPSEEDLISALNHRLRRQILRTMHSLDRPVSPADLEELLGLGDKLGSKLSSVSYHVTVLAHCHAIYPAGTRPVRGALEHFYDSAVADRQWLIDLLERTRETDKAQLWPKKQRQARSRKKAAKKPGR